MKEKRRGKKGNFMAIIISLIALLHKMCDAERPFRILNPLPGC